MEAWYAVRCVFSLGPADASSRLYEERITLWKAQSFEEAVTAAEDEAVEYANALDGTYLGLAQCYRLDGTDAPSNSDEIFSLVREDDLAPDEYLDRFFATGRECQGHID